VLSIGTLCGAAKTMTVRQRRLLYVFLSGCAACALVAVIQVVADFVPGLSDPIWQRASDLLDMKLPSRISSRAEIPPIAIGHFLIVITSFMSGFLVGTSRRDSELLTIFARYSILLYAIYGLLALAFTPNMLLWAPKIAYRGSLTATFVNHNTAATFIGAGAILWLCSAFYTLQSMDASSFRLLLLTPSNEDVAFKFILRAAAGLICFFALLLTGSRGGLICSSLGLLVAIGLVVADRIKEARSLYIVGCAGVAVAVTLGWLSQMGRIGSQGLFDDGRWSAYGYCIEAIQQRPWLGAGIGTFADLFPSLRGPDFNRWGVWDYAHSTILEIAVEMGIPVAALVLVGAIASLIILVRAALRLKGRNQSSMAAVTGIAVLSYLHSIIDFSLQIPGYLIVFWILLGCWLARATAEESASQEASRDRSAEKKSTGQLFKPTGAENRHPEPAQ
jgi:O-antigen ligase